MWIPEEGQSRSKHRDSWRECVAHVQRSAKVGVDGGEMHTQRWRGDPGATRNQRFSLSDTGNPWRVEARGSLSAADLRIVHFV